MKLITEVHKIYMQHKSDICQYKVKDYHTSTSINNINKAKSTKMAGMEDVQDLMLILINRVISLILKEKRNATLRAIIVSRHNSSPRSIKAKHTQKVAKVTKRYYVLLHLCHDLY